LPTVHISLPSRVYEELKKKAAELGIQVTDLVKLYIRYGLQNGLTPTPYPSSTGRTDIGILEKRLQHLEKEIAFLKSQVISSKGKYVEAMEFFNYLNDRIDTLEEMIIPLLRSKEAREEAK